MYNNKIITFFPLNSELFCNILHLSNFYLGEFHMNTFEIINGSYGIGDKLMCRALDWLDFNNCKSKIIGVAEGNDSVIKFYEKYGFYTKTIILQQLKD